MSGQVELERPRGPRWVPKAKGFSEHIPPDHLSILLQNSVAAELAVSFWPMAFTGGKAGEEPARGIKALRQTL